MAIEKSLVNGMGKDDAQRKNVYCLYKDPSRPKNIYAA